MIISTYRGGVNRENNRMELKKKKMKRRRNKKVLIKRSVRTQRAETKTPEKHQSKKPEQDTRARHQSEILERDTRAREVIQGVQVFPELGSSG